MRESSRPSHANALYEVVVLLALLNHAFSFDTGGAGEGGSFCVTTIGGGGGWDGREMR
jgi:hypothetical protein